MEITNTGIYEILGESDKVLKDGHKLLHVRCTVCGVEKDIRAINLGATKCTHKRKIEPKKCLACDQVIPFNSTTKYAAYRLQKFCSKSCAASYNNQITAKSITSRLKAAYTALMRLGATEEKIEQHLTAIKEGKKLELKSKKRKRAYQSIYYEADKLEGIDYVVCPYCNLRFSMLMTSHLKQHSKTIEDLQSDFGKDYQLVSDVLHAKRVSAGKLAQKKLIDEGRHKGWQSRSVRSYAENFWETVLKNNNISFIQELVVKKSDLGIENDSSNYFLDFYLTEKHVDLEIDGKQHEYSDRKEHDKIRDQILTENGYIVYRIPYINPVYKDEVKQQIDLFLTWYSSLQ